MTDGYIAPIVTRPQPAAVDAGAIGLKGHPAASDLVILPTYLPTMRVSTAKINSQELIGDRKEEGT